MKTLSNPSRQSSAPLTIPLLTRDRRHEHRGPVHSKAVLTVLDGVGASDKHEIVTRDMAISGVSFLLRQSLAVGQSCRIDIDQRRGVDSFLCEVVRSRPLSNGKHEMSVQFRRKL